MEQQDTGYDLAEFTQADTIQAEAAYQRIVFEGGQITVARLLQAWSQLDAREALAYEDKVAAQVRVLREASLRLWHLHKDLAQTCRRLKKHRRQLR